MAATFHTMFVSSQFEINSVSPQVLHIFQGLQWLIQKTAGIYSSIGHNNSMLTVAQGNNMKTNIDFSFKDYFWEKQASTTFEQTPYLIMDLRRVPSLCTLPLAAALRWFILEPHVEERRENKERCTEVWSHSTYVSKKKSVFSHVLKQCYKVRSVGWFVHEMDWYTYIIT